MKLHVLFFLFFILFSVNAENSSVNASFEKGLNSWKTDLPEKSSSNDASDFYEIDKNDPISLKVTKNSSLEAVNVSSCIFDLKPQASYDFRINYKTKGINQTVKTAIRIRIAVWDADGNPLKKHYKWFELPASTAFITKVFNDNKIIMDTKAAKGAITIFFYGQGEYYINNLSFCEESVSEDKSFVSEGKKFFYRPRDTEKDLPVIDCSENPSEDYIIYKRNPRMMYPDSIPQPEERISKLRQFTVPGEYAVFYFSLYARKSLSISSFSITDLVNANGNKLSADKIQIKEVKFWKQMAGNSNSSYYYIIPELIERFEPSALDVAHNKLFWIQFRVPHDQSAGIYEGNVSVVFENGNRGMLPVSLRILPFCFGKSNALWGIYSPLRNKKSYEEKLQVLRDIKDYGMENFLERVIPRFDIKNGSVENFDFQKAAELIKLKKEAGMSGAWVNIIQQILEKEIIVKLNGKAPPADNFPFKENDDNQVQEIFISLLKEMDKTVKSVGGKEYSDWYYQCIDEPHQGSRVQQAVWELQLAKKAGVKKLATAYALSVLEKLAGCIDVSLNSYIAKNKELFDAYMAFGKKYNMTYWYLGAGCYSGQEGGLMPDRYIAGFLFFKTGLPCHIAWTYQWVRGDPFNDFDCLSNPEPKDFCIVYPPRHKSGPSIPTLQWEGIREGIIDYKYADTLKKYIEKAKEKGFEQDAVKSEKVLQDCMSRVPWYDDYKSGDCYSLPGNFTSDKADKLRWTLAQEIIRLKGVINE